jgi:hypothetical protein
MAQETTQGGIMTLPRVITADELVKGQHIQVRHDYDQHHSTTYEGFVVNIFGRESVLLKNEEHERWVVNQPKIDVTVTLLADPEPQYEVGQLAEITFKASTNYGIQSSVPIRAWWSGSVWRLIGPPSTPMDYVVSPIDISSVTLLRLARPEDVLIPVDNQGKVSLGERVKHVHEVVDMLTGGVGGRFYMAMAHLFCDEIDHTGMCCVKHKTHAHPHSKNCRDTRGDLHY